MTVKGVTHTVAKIGREVEGQRNLGLRTLFVSADEYVQKFQEILNLVEKEPIEHIYISDHEGTIQFSSVKPDVLAKLRVHVTVEVKSIKHDYPHWVGIMLNITDGTSIEQLDRLRYNDEIKVSVGLDVWCWNKRDAVRTRPADFDEDIEVSL